MAADSTGNTKLGRELLVAFIVWILSLDDPCHQMSNTCKDICKLAYFADVGALSVLRRPELTLRSQCIAKMRKIIKFFKKSSFASTHLAALRVLMEITEGLEGASKTRFATMSYAAASVERCLPAIKVLVKEGIIDVSKKVRCSSRTCPECISATYTVC